MPWQLQAHGHIVADWNAGLALQHTDPYLAWLDLSRFAGVALPQGRLLPVIEQTSGERRFQTRARAIADLAQMGDRLQRGEVLRFEVAAGAVSDDGQLQAEADASPEQIASARVSRRTGNKPVVGFIDYGCAFAHRQFRSPDDPLATRVKALWHQGGSPRMRCGELQWQRPGGYWYGAETHRDVELAAGSGALTMNAWMRRHASGSRIDEEACYRHSGYAPVIGKRFTHGTHTLDLATGWPSPLRHLSSLRAPAPTSPHDADIVFVQLPSHVEGKPVSGLLRANVYDALRYIIDCTPDKQPCVVNLSYGANAGPHDGSSLLELAMDWRVQRALKQRGVCAQLVVAAGNSRQSAMHACADVAAGGAAEIEWHNLPDDPSNSFVELWLPHRDAGFSVSVTAPDGTATTQAVMPGQVVCLQQGSGLAAALVFARQVCQSPRGTMALLAVARTRPRLGQATAPYGAWRIAVHNDAGRPAQVHAWCERDTPAFGSEGQPRQGRFVTTASSRIDGESTLNSIAHGWQPLVVGGHVGGRSVAAYSGTGPGRDLGEALQKQRARCDAGAGGVTRRGPNQLAPSDESAAVPGLLAAALIGTDRVRMNGTSAAAALVTRQIIEANFQVPAPRPGPPLAAQGSRHPDSDLLS